MGRLMSYGWIRGIDCPVCGGERKDCRQSERTKLISCRVRDAAPRDYIYVGEDAIGFGMWQHVDDRATWLKEQRQMSEFEREQRRLEHLRIDREREKAEKEKYALSLSVEERDLEIRKILNQLFLWPSHQKSLRDRFKVVKLEIKEIDHLIAQAGYKSVRQWQKLDHPVRDQLAGVRLGGLSLLVPGDGMLIPVRNEKGLYTGLQVRLDNPTGGSKYIWLAGERKRANRPGSKLQNGELPLAIYLPQTNLDNKQFNLIGLAEGVGFKPQIAAERLGIPFIGASGGHFSNSPELLRNYLDFLLAKHSVTKGLGGDNHVLDKPIYEEKKITNSNKPVIVLFADAGSIKDETVIKSYKKTFDLLKKWGHSVKVAWWEQVDKSIGDIDEISSDRLGEIKYISVSKYLKLCSPTLRANFEKREILRELQHDYHLKKEYQEYCSLKKLTYKPTLLLNVKRLPDLILKIRGIIAIASEKNTGKTYQLNRLKNLALANGQIVVSLTPRVMLAREQAGKLDINHIDDDGYYKVEEMELEITIEENRQYGLLGEDKVKYTKKKVVEKKLIKVDDAKLADAIALCYDSFLKLYPREDWRRVVFIIDEAETGLKHLLMSNTLKTKRSQILAALEETMGEALAHEGAVILLDADLSDPTINYIRSFCPTAPLTVIVNKHKTPYPWDIDFYSGTKKNKEKVYQQIVEAIAEDKRIAIALDSQQEARALEKLLCDRFPEKAKQFQVCDSEFSETKEGKEFIENINSSLTKKPLWMLNFTPTIYIGVSIDVDAFDLVFGIFTGVLTPSEIRQSLARYRKPVPRIIWVKSVGLIQDGRRSTSVAEISQLIFDYNMESLISTAKTKISRELGRKAVGREVLQRLNELFDDKTGEFKCPHNLAYVQFKARENYEKLNLAKLLQLELIEEGHNLVDRSSEDESDNNSSSNYYGDIKDNKKEIKDRYYSAMSCDRDIPLDLAKQILNKSSSTKEERRVARKAILKDRLPGVELTADRLKKIDDPHWFSGVRLFWLYQNREAAEHYDQAAWDRVISHLEPIWYKKSDQILEGSIYLPDIKTWLPKIQLIEDLKLFNLVNLEDLDKKYTDGAREVIEFKKLALCHRERLKTIFNITVTKKTSAIGLINSLLNKLGLILKHRRVRVNQELQRIYQLDRAILQDSDRLAILQGMSAKYINWRENKEWPIFNNYSSPGENPSQPDEETVPPGAEIIYHQQGEVEHPLSQSEVEIEPPGFTEHLDSVERKSVPIEQYPSTRANSSQSDGQTVPLGAEIIYHQQGEVEHPLSQSEVEIEPPDLNLISRSEHQELTNESQFILDLLKDLENRNPRFKTTTQIEELLSKEFENRIIAVEKELLSEIPDFYSRFLSALVPLLEELPAPIDNPSSLKEHFSLLYDNQEAIKKIAGMLSKVDNSSQLMALTQREFYSRDRFNKAVLLLPKDLQQQLRSISDELNQSLDKNRPFSYLERFRSLVGKTVKAAINNAGGMLSNLGEFVGLEIIDEQSLARVIVDGISYYCQPDELKFSSD